MMKKSLSSRCGGRCNTILLVRWCMYDFYFVQFCTTYVIQPSMIIPKHLSWCHVITNILLSGQCCFFRNIFIMSPTWHSCSEALRHGAKQFGISNMTRAEVYRCTNDSMARVIKTWSIGWGFAFTYRSLRMLEGNLDGIFDILNVRIFIQISMYCFSPADDIFDIRLMMRWVRCRSVHSFFEFTYLVRLHIFYHANCYYRRLHL